MTTTPQAALLSDALEKMGDFFRAHEAWQLCRIDDGRIQLHLTDDQYEAVRLAVADKLKPRSSTLTNDELIDLAVEHGLGRTLPPLGLNTGNVFYTDNSYRTAALFDFADAHEAAILAKLQATQEPVQAGELPPLPSSAHWEERIKTLMQQTPLPNSMSVYQAFKQFQNEFEHATVEYARAALSARKPLTDEQRKMFKNVTYMLDAYVECIKSSGEYEAWHYIPEIEATRDDLNSYVSDAHGIGLEVKP